MGAPTSLLRQARGFAQDFARDEMPAGYLWNCVDFVPAIIDAVLTGRGGWTWGSDAGTSDYQSGILATFKEGDQLLVQNAGNRLHEIPLTPPPYGATIDHAATFPSLQNPVQIFDGVDTVVHFPADGSRVPQLWRHASWPDASATMKDGTAAKHPIVGTVFQSKLVTGGAPGEENAIRLTFPGADLTTPDAFDPLSVYPTAQRVTALAGLRSSALIFHPGSVQRLRGTIPAATGIQGDMFIETLFDRAGCQDPKSIAYWNDNCVFADEHGVHITDGAVIRNLVVQGGISSFWRPLWANKVSVSACTFLDYYMITVRSGTPLTATTLVCDLNRRVWFRFSNIPAICFVSSGGSAGMERAWAGMAGTNRLARVSPVFFPTPSGQAADADGTTVLPYFETPWYRLGEEGRKRIRFVYVSYDVRTGALLEADDLAHTHEDPFIPSGGAKAVADVLQVGYIRSPQDPNYIPVGHLPSTGGYSRYRLPVGQFPYGAAFRVEQISASTVTRVFDIAVEAQAAERSRV